MGPGWLCPQRAANGQSSSSSLPSADAQGLRFHREPSFSKTLKCLCLIVSAWNSNVTGLFLGSFPVGYFLSSLLPAPFIPSQRSPSLVLISCPLCQAVGRPGVPGSMALGNQGSIHSRPRGLELPVSQVLGAILELSHQRSRDGSRNL